MANFTAVKNQFHNLSVKEQGLLLKDLYEFSKDVRLFLEGRLLGGDSVANEYIAQMEREAVGKVYREGIPGTPNGRIVNSIIGKAKKSYVGIRTMMELEKLAYHGFIEFLNKYGADSESFDEQACNHLGTYLRLTQDMQILADERSRIFQDVKKYLLDKNNMFTDMLDETYERVTGIRIDRSG